MTALIFILLLVLLALNLPVFLGLTVSSAAVIAGMPNIPMGIVLQRMFPALINSPLWLCRFYLRSQSHEPGRTGSQDTGVCQYAGGTQERRTGLHRCNCLYVSGGGQRFCSCNRHCHLLYHASHDDSVGLWERIFCGADYGLVIRGCHHSAQYRDDCIRNRDRDIHWPVVYSRFPARHCLRSVIHDIQLHIC